VSLVVRPERITLEPSATGRPGTAAPMRAADGAGAAGGVNRLAGRVERTTFRGAQTQVTIALAGCTLVADVPNVHGEVPDWLHEGREVWTCIAPGAIKVLSRLAADGAASHAPSGS
jgi:hypothetical protein